MAVMMTACSSPISEQVNYRREMIKFVSAIRSHARARRPGFLVIGQNGLELLSPDYLAVIDGVGQESLHFSHAVEGRATGDEHRQYFYGVLKRVKDAGKRVLITDYVETSKQAQESHRLNKAAGFEGFAATSRELDSVDGNGGAFLYLINPGKFPDKESYLTALAEAEHEMLIIDTGFSGDDLLTSEDVKRLKKNGRPVLAYLSIGEAETYRPYWDPSWKQSPPPWLAEENPDWSGNIKVHYWEPAWQKIILGSPDAALDKILDAGFDGVYLDIIDAFGYFEAKRVSSAAS